MNSRAAFIFTLCVFLLIGTGFAQEKKKSSLWNWIYGDSGKKTEQAEKGKYLGRLSANPQDPDSISNPYGQYGSPYSSESVRNPYGVYGSPYSSKSPSNRYTTVEPKIYVEDGTYLGRYNSNRYDPESVSNPYGVYGSKYSPNSINNPYSTYGNKFSPYSVSNPYTTQASKLYNCNPRGSGIGWSIYSSRKNKERD